MHDIELHHGVHIPVLGLGTWQLQGQDCVDAVTQALAVGYRHIDTALHYGNHTDIARAIRSCQVSREEVFITSKIWHEDLTPSSIEQQTHQILSELETDYVDLLLIHWPNSRYDLIQAVSALEEQRRDGKVRSIGVSNFTQRHLETVQQAEVAISMNQVEYHPSLNQERLRQYCQSRGIAMTAYSPLAQGQDLKLNLIQELAERYDVSPSQVVLNWLLQKGIVAIPRSKNPDYIADNLAATRWQLTEADVAAIDAIGGHNRILNPPFAEFNDEM